MRPLHFLNKTRYKFLGLILIVCALYGTGRLYYRITDGFTESNIQYQIPYDSRWDVVPLAEGDKKAVEQILNQDYHYLGKGCQSYVFASDDGEYVIKFFKYQRFRPQAWLDNFAFIPPLDSYRLRKIEKKKHKLDNVFASWKMAYEDLQPETGVLYVHLNKVGGWGKKLVIYDKMGLKHELDLNSLEFMVQKKANMLCSELIKFKQTNDLVSGKNLIDSLLTLLLSEYARGYADNDHALMQNTGVYRDKPIHIDVGQFVKNSIASDPKVYRQELFSKMWKFRIWLRKEYPELADYTDERLSEAIGPSFATLTPQLNKSSMGRIPANATF
ncbi:MAG: hypothetical protein H0T62_03695 [Parachlamydiaceae bacterium]|nr:hypothetical protein [Parachlamydiaceae bacterium]